ncbi:MAG TPA: group II intron maturase-specific domain-containing protein [Vicinamibacterales bacterium]
MRREFHVRFCEGGGVQFPSATRLVVMCRTRAAVEEAQRRVGAVLTRLGLELHPEKTRLVDLSWGHGGLDFLGCHLRKRLSGPIWERERKRIYFLQRWPSQRAMRQVRARLRALTPRSRCHADLRTVIARVNPVVRGWGQYFRTGNAATRFLQLDRYVEDRLRGLLLKRHGSRLAPGRANAWRRPFFEALGLCRLRRHRPVSGGGVMPRPDRPPESRVREIRTHGLNGGLTNTRPARPAGFK